MKLLPPNPVLYQLRPNWKYVPSQSTDISKTFKRVREFLAQQKTKPSKVKEFKKNEQRFSG